MNIKFKDVSLTYSNQIKALVNASFEIQPGEFVFLVGQSGSGKSSILKMMLKEIVPNTGVIEIDNKDISKLTKKEIPYFRRRLGVVFQDFRLLLDKNVFENIAYAMKIVEAPIETIEIEVNKVLECVGLADKGHLLPNELSGGEQQRVAIARALVNNPQILICDEPTGNLDPINALEIMNILEQINNNGTTIVMATHDSNLVNKMKKRVITLEKGTIIKDEDKGGYELEI